ncbi:recombinase family protein [Plantactinospora mayteni]|uniref:recombinase family protein n=1 Tax=Plantactinospora mayteni TaxID=566021 RepID=UPI001EF7337A|nr:recombinase family protein [Plantactinospora mayteni]
MANRTVAEQGEIVSEYFDIGCSRRLPWHARPQAAALLAAATQQCRVFDAVIVGEYERAFHGDQFIPVAAVLAVHGVRLWLPETCGPVDLNDPTHQALVMLLGHQSKREVLRARFRTTMAMRAQVRDQGRHLGGRPPYGYRLVDAGPHPNTADARWGRRLHRLAPDPVTARHVQWIFAQRIAGTSAGGIARTLNHLGVPSPSEYDRSRNWHRTAEGWTVRTVAEILANPRYTGRQVWNRQYTDHQETEPGDRRTSRGSVRRWNPRDQWVLSARSVHRPLVSEADFVKAQTVNAIATPEDGQPRRYLLTGLVICRTCGRRADAHWCTDGPDIGADMATPAPARRYPADRNRCTYAKTCSSPASHGNSTSERRKSATTRELPPRTCGRTRSPSPATPTQSPSTGSRRRHEFQARSNDPHPNRSNMNGFGGG